MPGEQEHHICLYRFSFHKPIKLRLARGRLYLPFTTYNRTTESATLRPLNSGYGMDAYKGDNDKVQSFSMSKVPIFNSCRNTSAAFE